MQVDKNSTQTQLKLEAASSSFLVKCSLITRMYWTTVSAQIVRSNVADTGAYWTIFFNFYLVSSLSFQSLIQLVYELVA